MKEVIEVLEEIKPGIDYNKEKHLVTDELITSFDIVMLVPLLNEKFNIEISVMDLLPENFESAETIYDLVSKLK